MVQGIRNQKHLLHNFVYTAFERSVHTTRKPSNLELQKLKDFEAAVACIVTDYLKGA